MIVRVLDVNHDWTFGRGKNNYITGIPAVAQDIQTRLLSFLGDCFFAINEGIDWFNLLGGKSKTAIDLAINAVILNTRNVTGILEISSTLDNNRVLTIVFSVQTAFGPISDTFQYDVGQG